MLAAIFVWDNFLTFLASAERAGFAFRSFSGSMLARLRLVLASPKSNLLGKRLSSMRTILTLACCLLLLCAARASAQAVPPAVPAGKVNFWEASLGYAYINHLGSGSDDFGLNGFDATATLGLNPHAGVRADLGYALSGDRLGTTTDSSIFSYLIGPVFYPTRKEERLSPYVQALFGGARVSGPIAVPGGVLVGGYANGFAWAVGGGVTYRVTNAFSARFGLDYLRTGYFGPTRTIEAQSNLRATASVVYSFEAPWRLRRRR